MISSMSSKPVRALAVVAACAGLALSAVACGGPGAADASSQSGGLVGQPAPDFTAEVIGGDGPKTLKEGQGKVVILDFWGTFCEPCKKSFPKYQEIVDQFPGEVAVLAVAVDEPDNTSKEKLLQFAKDNHAKFAIVWDKDPDGREEVQPADTMPSSYIIDKAGVVRHVHVGFKDGDDAKVAQEVKALLGQVTGRTEATIAPGRRQSGYGSNRIQCRRVPSTRNPFEIRCSCLSGPRHGPCHDRGKTMTTQKPAQTTSALLSSAA